MTTPKTFFLLGCIFSLLGVAFGAFGAHALKQKLSPELLQVFETGVRYQMYHAFALFAVSWAMSSWNVASAGAAGWWFTAGIVLFSGSLYALALTDVRWLGAITPFGGLSFLIGWGWLAWSVWKSVQ
ncbi:MAG TPA: DUF423 domain-containing protein [Bacteroidota bacterium]|nr:DUF423 domain-containing protein [Bacteroidota bacterium]